MAQIPGEAPATVDRTHHRPVPGGADVPETLTVDGLLAEPLLRNTLVAGSSGTRRCVRWCLPLSEMAATIDGDGIVIHAPVERIRGDAGPETVRRVRECGAAALLVRLEPADLARPADLWSAFPKARAAADSVGLPFALLPPGADYRTMNQLVATKVLAQSTHVMEYRDRVHRALGEILARGAGVSALAYAMSRMGKAPMLVVDLDANPLAYENAGGSGTPPRSP